MFATLARCGDAPARIEPDASFSVARPADSEATAACSRYGFADDPIHWSVPDAALIGEHVSFAGLADLDGDGRLDYVTQSLHNTAPSELFVYRNDGDRFDATPRHFAIPEPIVSGREIVGYPSGCQWSVFEIGCFGEGLPRVDLDGDGLVDLVATTSHDWNSPLISGEWHVYRNLGGAFDAVPIVWPVPSDLGGLALASLETHGCAMWDGVPTVGHALIDTDHDGRRDLVVWTCDSGVFGASRSLFVYANTGSGFARERVDWPLPGSDESSIEEFMGRPIVSFVDGRLDRVVRRNGQWIAYRGLGPNVEPAGTTFVVPSLGRYDDPLFYSASDCWNSGRDFPRRYSHFLFGMHRGEIDLVITEDCRQPGGLGTAFWNVFRATHDGFETTPMQWSLPRNISGVPGSQCERELADLDGDGVTDLVLHGACVGTPEWLVYRGGCQQRER